MPRTPRVAGHPSTRLRHGRLPTKRRHDDVGGSGIAHARRRRAGAKDLAGTDHLVGQLAAEDRRPLMRHAAPAVGALEIGGGRRDTAWIPVAVPAVAGIVELAEVSQVAVRRIPEPSVAQERVVRHLVAPGARSSTSPGSGSSWTPPSQCEIGGGVSVSMNGTTSTAQLPLRTKRLPDHGVVATTRDHDARPGRAEARPLPELGTFGLLLSWT